MMTEKTRPIENILQTLADMCYETLNERETLDQNRVDALVKSLVTNGWERHAEHEEPLKTQIEKRVRERNGEEEQHHSEQIVALTSRIQKAYDDANRFQTSVPEDQKPVSKRESLKAKSPSTPLDQ